MPADATTAEGTTYIDVPVKQANAELPTGKLLVPGGRLTKLGPEAFAEHDTATTCYGSAYRIGFTETQGALLRVMRIFMSLPVWLRAPGAAGASFTATTTTEVRTYQSEVERNEYGAGKEGVTSESTRSIPPGYDVRGEEIVTERSGVVKGTNQIKWSETINTRRGVLPITLQIVIRLLGPQGELWSDTREVVARFRENENPKEEIGVGLLEGYADLTNPIVLDPRNGKPYGIQIEVFVPTLESTLPQVGPEQTAPKTASPGKGFVRVFYDVVPTTAGH